MENIKANFHTHLYLCKHATGNTDDYVSLAVKKGYERIGISDHGYVPSFILEKTRRMTKEQYKDIYLKELREAKEKYKGQIEVFFGLEIEYCQELTELYDEYLTELDYLILGQHLFKKDGKYISVYYKKLSDQDIIDYTDQLVEGLKTKKFRILAHPEIFAHDNLEWTSLHEELSKRIITAAIESNTILELNVNGLRTNKYAQIIYPRMEFWKLVSETNALVMVNDDCHSLEHLGDEATIKGYELAKKLKLNLVSNI